MREIGTHVGSLVVLERDSLESRQIDVERVYPTPASNRCISKRDRDHPRNGRQLMSRGVQNFRNQWHLFLS